MSFPAMPQPAHIRQARVAFADTDASGRMHFPNVFRYVEDAEHEFLRSLGIPVLGHVGGGWPRVRVECDFLAPLGFDDPIEVRLFLSRIGRSSLGWKFEIADAARQRLAARGAMSTARVEGGGGAIPIPDDERALLAKHLTREDE